MGQSFDSPMAASTFLLPGAYTPDLTRVGDPLKNSIVASAVNYVNRVFPEAPPQIVQQQKDGSKSKLDNHPLIKLIQKPNPESNGALLFTGLLTSLVLDGNGYWLKVRNKAGKVIELWYLFHGQVNPVPSNKVGSYIDHYEYRDALGQMTIVPKADMVHFRTGTPDPERPYLGLSPLKAVLKEIVADNEATAFATALLKNAGVPGLIITPRDPKFDIDPDTFEAIKNEFIQRASGNNRGKPIVMSAGVVVTKLAFSPEEMNLENLHRIPEERVSAVLGIPAIVLGLGAGLDASTYSNLEQARQIAYENFIVPLQASIALEIQNQLIPEFESNPESLEFGFDLTKVRVLQTDQNELATRMNIGVQGGWIMVSEARHALGLPVSDSDRVYLRNPGLVVVNFDGTVLNPPAPSPVAVSKAIFKANLNWTDNYLDKMATFNQSDIKKAKELWVEYAPVGLNEILDSSDFTFNSDSADWFSENKAVNPKELNKALEMFLDGMASEMKGLADNVLEADNDENKAFLPDVAQKLTEWSSGMLDKIKSVQLISSALALGGVDKLKEKATDVKANIKEQYKYLDNFVKEVQKAGIVDGTLSSRSAMYAGAGSATYEVDRRQAKEDAGFVSEIRVITSEESCDDCLAETAKGWSPIGSLRKIGDSQCLVNCKCYFEYSKDISPE